MSLTKSLALVGISLTVAALTGCGGSSSSSSGGAPNCTAGTATATNQVTIQSMAFSPACIKVTAPATVTFTNNGGITHTVTADDATYDSGNLPATQAFQHAFSTPGTSHYHCTIHPGMTGTVIVQ